MEYVMNCMKGVSSFVTARSSSVSCSIACSFLL